MLRTVASPETFVLEKQGSKITEADHNCDSAVLCQLFFRNVAYRGFALGAVTALSLL